MCSIVSEWFPSGVGGGGGGEGMTSDDGTPSEKDVK